MRREKVDPPKRFNKIIFFIIEVAYWAEYYIAKKTDDKMDSISTGFNFIYTLLLIYIIIILASIDSVFTILPPTPKETALGFFLFVISLVILTLVVPYYITFIIYKRVSKKELIRYFDEMTPERRRIGKIKYKVFLFASYSWIPLMAFFFLVLMKP